MIRFPEDFTLGFNDEQMHSLIGGTVRLYTGMIDDVYMVTLREDADFPLVMEVIKKDPDMPPKEAWYMSDDVVLMIHTLDQFTVKAVALDRYNRLKKGIDFNVLALERYVDTSI